MSFLEKSVLEKSFLPGNAAVIVPKTSDGRVIFLIPWNNHTLIGTTDTAIPKSVLEPIATEGEIEFLLETSGRYLSKKPTHNDILSVFVGIRPLVKAKSVSKSTSKLSRDHTIEISKSGLLTITGGKWTTEQFSRPSCLRVHASPRIFYCMGQTPRPSRNGSRRTRP